MTSNQKKRQALGCLQVPLFFNQQKTQAIIHAKYIFLCYQGTHIVAHVINAKRFSVNYSLKFKDLNFASYHNQVS